MPPDDAPAGFPADAVALGRVAGAWGVQGWLRVSPFNDSRDSSLNGLRRWWLCGPAGARALDIESTRVHGDDILAKAVGVEDRDQAQALKGCEVMVGRAEFPRAAEGEVYWVDLIGCTVRNPRGDPLGTVAAVEEFGADPVLRVGQHLIPLVPRHVLAIDLAARAIVADWEPDY